MRIIKLSGAAFIAVHAAAAVAEAEGRAVPASEIARRIDVSENHAAKVMRALVRGGIIKSKRGPAGGFRLAKKPGRITVFDILSIITGESLKGGGCPLRCGKCVFEKCIFGNLIQELEAGFKEYAVGKTLADLKGAR